MFMLDVAQGSEFLSGFFFCSLHPNVGSVYSMCVFI